MMLYTIEIGNIIMVITLVVIDRNKALFSLDWYISGIGGCGFATVVKS